MYQEERYRHNFVTFRSNCSAINQWRSTSRVESEEEQTDSEDDEYMDDVELKSTLLAKKGGRRESVSAEQVGGDIVSTVGADCTLPLRARFCARISPFLMRVAVQR